MSDLVDILQTTGLLLLPMGGLSWVFSSKTKLNLKEIEKSLAPYKEEGKLGYNYARNLVNKNQRYLLRNKKLQKHFGIEETIDHSDKYKWKEFFGDEGNKYSVIYGGVLSLLPPHVPGLGIALITKATHKIGEKIAIYSYLKQNKIKS